MFNGMAAALRYLDDVNFRSNRHVARLVPMVDRWIRLNIKSVSASIRGFEAKLAHKDEDALKHPKDQLHRKR